MICVLGHQPCTPSNCQREVNTDSSVTGIFCSPHPSLCWAITGNGKWSVHLFITNKPNSRHLKQQRKSKWACTFIYEKFTALTCSQRSTCDKQIKIIWYPRFYFPCNSVGAVDAKFCRKRVLSLPPHSPRALRGRKIGLPFEQLIYGNIWGEQPSEVPGECLVLIASLKPEQLHWGRGYIRKIAWRLHSVLWRSSGTLSLHLQRAYS